MSAPASSTPALPPVAPRPSRDVLRVVAVVLALALLFWLVPIDRARELLDVEALRARAALGGSRAFLTFLAGVSLLVFTTGQLFLPVVVGAALFGALWGPLLAMLGVAIGSVGQFFLLRYALRGPAERLLARRWPSLRDALAARGFGLLVFLRFIWFPGGLTTAGAALAPISGRAFLAALPALWPQAVIIGFATDSVATFGWKGVPPLRWLVFATMVVGALGAYWAAVRRWPSLRAITRRPASTP